MEKQRAIYKLHTLLCEQKLLLEEMLDLLIQEQDALFDSQMQKLSEISKRKELLVLQQAHIDNQLHRVKDQLSDIIGNSGNKLRLQNIIAEVEGSLKSKLISVKEELSELLVTIQQASKLNQDLINVLLSGIDDASVVIRAHQRSRQTYTANGAVNRELTRLFALSTA